MKAVNAKYITEVDKHRCKEFQEGDLVMAYLRRSRFLDIRAKLEKRRYGPFHVAWRINDNAFVLQLPDN